MRPLAIATVVLMIAAYSNMAYLTGLDDDEIMLYSFDEAMSIEKREAEKDSTEAFNTFIEEKLMQQSQALEHLIKTVDDSGSLIKNLIDNLSKGIEKPKLPAKAEAEEVHPKMIRSNVSEHRDHPLVRLGKNIPKYGKLAKDLIMKEILSGTDPTPLVEQGPGSSTFPELGSRRSFGGNPVLIPSQKDDDKTVNPWCPLALLCQQTVDPICGFDDEFGYGRFEDLCHMLRVNCYWKFNFSMVYTCRPRL